MRNVTISMDEEVARWARIAAAEREMSLSRFVGDLVRQRMRRERDYEHAMAEFLALQPQGGSGGKPLPRREELHERSVLRR